MKSKICMGTLLACVWIMACGWISAEPSGSFENSGMDMSSEAVLTMPISLQIIEEEAFYGSTSIDKVVLSDEVKEIHARAFADSTLSEINLPDSLTFIDPSAFDGPEKVTVTANPGTYAYEWAAANHYFNILPVITGNNNVVVTANNETICKFVASGDGIYIFTTTGSKDTMGVLYDSSMSMITEDDDSGDGYNFSIEYSLTSGEVVYIGVKYYSSYESGTETLVIGRKLDPPTDVTVTADSDTSVTVSWDHGMGMDGYRIEYAADPSESDPWSISVDKTATSKQITGLTAGTMYYFRVGSYNSDGCAYSDWKSLTQSGINWSYIVLGVDRRSQSDIRSFASSHPASLSGSSEFLVTPSTSEPYSIGLLTQEAITNGLNMLNQCRYVAGLNADVANYPEMEEMLGAATLVNYLNRGLSHNPGRPDELSDAKYDTLYNNAYSGASQSNLAWGVTNMAEAVLLYMEDSDSSNIDRVGHRRWILNPSMGKTTFGRCGSFSALYAFDSSGSGNQRRVAWPAQQTPVSMFDDYHAWSVSYGEYLNIDTIRVTLTRESDGRIWNFTSSEKDGDFFVDNVGYGLPGCVIFRPDSNFSANAGDAYQVYIYNEDDYTCLMYRVNFFNL